MALSIPNMLSCTDEYAINEIFQMFNHHLAHCFIIIVKTLLGFSQQKVAVLQIKYIRR